MVNIKIMATVTAKQKHEVFDYVKAHCGMTYLTSSNCYSAHITYAGFDYNETAHYPNEARIRLALRISKNIELVQRFRRFRYSQSEYALQDRLILARQNCAVVAKIEAAKREKYVPLSDVAKQAERTPVRPCSAPKWVEEGMLGDSTVAPNPILVIGGQYHVDHTFVNTLYNRLSIHESRAHFMALFTYALKLYRERHPSFKTPKDPNY